MLTGVAGVGSTIPLLVVLASAGDLPPAVQFALWLEALISGCLGTTYLAVGLLHRDIRTTSSVWLRLIAMLSAALLAATAMLLYGMWGDRLPDPVEVSTPLQLTRSPSPLFEPRAWPLP